MVRPSGSRVLLFLFGTTFGLLIGAGFFIFKIDEYLGKMELFSQQSSDSLLVEENKSDNEQVRNFSGKTKLSNSKNTATGSDTNYHSTSSVQPADSFFADSLFRGEPFGDDQIEVKKDELLETRTILVYGNQPSQKSAKDSALQNMSGIREDKEIGGSLTVEFWASPINYKGYKMTRTKLSLFGFGEGADSKLHRIDGNIYLLLNGTVYKLEQHSDFRSLEKETNEEILNKIN